MRTVIVYLSILLAASRASALAGQNLLGSERIDVKTKSALVAVFLSAECPCSRSHLETLRRLAGDFPEVAFVAVHSNRDEPDAAKYFGGQKLPFPVIDDHDQKLAGRFGASRTPHAFVLDPAERVLYRGGVSDSTDPKRARHFPLREALEDLKARRSVRRKDARALGCTISRSGS